MVDIFSKQKILEIKRLLSEENATITEAKAKDLIEAPNLENKQLMLMSRVDKAFSINRHTTKDQLNLLTKSMKKKPLLYEGDQIDLNRLVVIEL